MPAERHLLSVIVCTHDRKDQLLRLLDRLGEQMSGCPGSEVIVVADACRDGTAEAVRERSAAVPFPLRLETTAARSAAIARNLGTAPARGDILVFMDDDMTPGPAFLGSHLRAQHDADVVIGYAKPQIPERPSLWQLRAKTWWEDRFLDMARPEHRFCYSDLFTGNLSVKAALFRQAGGFDESLARLEDYELGIRLLQAGARFAFCREALTFHRETGNQRRWLARLGMEGKTFVVMEEKHPGMRGRFHQTPPHASVSAAIRKVAFAFPMLSRAIRPALLLLPGTLELLKARTLWSKVLGALGELEYWSGVAAAYNRTRTLRDVIEREDVPLHLREDVPELRMSDFQSVDHATVDLRRANDEGLRVSLKDIPILHLLPKPGAEPLQAKHLVAPFRLIPDDIWTAWDLAPSLAHALRKCKRPVELLAIDLSVVGQMEPVARDVRSICVAGLWKGTLLGFLPVGRNEWERSVRSSLRSYLEWEFRKPLRDLAARMVLEEKAGQAVADAYPSISVVVTAHNHPADLQHCLESLTLIEYPDYEVIVVGVGCADPKIAAIMAGHAVRVGRLDAKTGDEARAAGTALAAGEIIAYLDSSHSVHPMWLKGLARGFRDPQTCAVASAVIPGMIRIETRHLYEFSNPAPDTVDPRQYGKEGISLQEIIGIEYNGLAATMAYRRSALQTAAGSPVAGGAAGETSHLSMIYTLLRSAYGVRYEPSALIRLDEPADKGHLAAILAGRNFRIFRFLRFLVVHDTTQSRATLMTGAKHLLLRIVLGGMIRMVRHPGSGLLRLILAEVSGAVSGATTSPMTQMRSAGSTLGS